MTRHGRDNLNAERTALQGLIDATPPEDVLDRASLLARLHAVDVRLSDASGNGSAVVANTRLPLSAKLTFRGRPVVGSYGIHAPFGMTATQQFTETVTAMAASLSGPLAATGPIPNRGDHQLLLTSTAVGSFGFAFEEAGGPLLFNEETAVGRALTLTQELLESTTASDDDLTDAAAGIDARVIKATREFLTTLAEHDAVCGLTVGGRVFRFADVGQVRTAIQRLSQDNLRESDETFAGAFQGALPKRRTFEFAVQGEEAIIAGKVGAGVSDPGVLNRHLYQPVRITLTATRVGVGRPRYVLNDVPSTFREL